ncbi:hypothetical protein [Xenorhabdus cabanillasii]|uniref:hypothetical protein n=1 Tax=Xenorhabdus cabanillasii TaxID=351673 RepID=UPI001145DCC6|nr:hypothetical protein [Xenorhabdus cabanillasii]
MLPYTLLSRERSEPIGTDITAAQEFDGRRQKNAEAAPDRRQVTHGIRKGEQAYRTLKSAVSRSVRVGDSVAKPYLHLFACGG